MKLEFNDVFKLPNGWECLTYSVNVEEEINSYSFLFKKNTRRKDGLRENRHLSVRGCPEGHFNVNFCYRNEQSGGEDRVEASCTGPSRDTIAEHDGSVGSIKNACIINAAVFFEHAVNAVLAKTKQGLEVLQ